MDNLLRDFRIALRGLARSPGFGIIVVVTLALGIGANAFVFSTARALLQRPLPIPDPQDVFFLQINEGYNHSFLNYVDFRDRAADIADFAAYRVAEVAFDTGAGARSSWGYLATGNYFSMLDIQPVVGRFFTPSEDVGRNSSPYVVLGHDFWTVALQGDPLIAGRTVRLNGQPFTVLGVAPEGFHGTEVFFRPDFWVPMTMAPQVEGQNWIDFRASHNVYVAGRLREGIPRGRAQAAVEIVAANLVKEYPEINRGLRVTLTTPGLFGDFIRTPVSAYANVALVLAILVLLAACTNLASLLAARVIERFRELAVRLALGATKSLIVRQLFVETFVLCIAGGLAGIAVAFFLLRALTRWRPAVGIPLAIDVSPDFVVMGCAASMAIAAALLAIGATARRVWRTDPSTLMRGSTGDGVIHRWRLREVLLGIQVSVCSLLVVACIVSIQGLDRARTTRLGFNPDGVSVASFDLNHAGYERERGQTIRTRALEEIAALPGIDGVTFTSSIPLTTDQSSDSVVSDVAPDSTNSVDANAFIVPPGYFAVMRTNVVAGREFTSSDDRPVAIVNETLAQRLFGTRDVVGRGIRRAPGQPLIEIVGIAEDGKYALPNEAPQPAIYWPASRAYRSRAQLLVRSSLSESEVARLIRQVFAQLDSSIPVAFNGPIRQVTSLAFLPARSAMVLLSAFGLLAVVLALTGTYGLAAFQVSARTREIGIRVAVGGRSRQVLGAVLGRTGTVLMVGAASGVLLAIAVSPLLSMVVYQASSRDPVILAVGVGTMVLIGLAAAWTPARRALRVDPVVALRES